MERLAVVHCSYVASVCVCVSVRVLCADLFFMSVFIQQRPARRLILDPWTLSEDVESTANWLLFFIINYLDPGT